jgi:hypothetical protein
MKERRMNFHILTLFPDMVMQVTEKATQKQSESTKAVDYSAYDELIKKLKIENVETVDAYKEKVKTDKSLYKKRLKDTKFKRKLEDMIDLYED